MSYTGNDPVTQSFVSGTDYFNGNGVTTIFTLSREVSSVNDIEVTVNNVQLSPLAYTTLGNELTLLVAPPTGSLNVIVRYLSTVLFQNLNTTNQGIGFLYNLIDTNVPFASNLLTQTVTNVFSATQIATSATGINVGDVISASTAKFSAVRVNALTPVIYSASPYTVSANITPPVNTFLVGTTATPALLVGGYVAFNNTGGSLLYRIVSKTVNASDTTITVTPNITDTVTSGAIVYIGYQNVLTVSSTAQWGPVGIPLAPTIYRWTLPNNNVSLIYNQNIQKWQASLFIGYADASNNVSFGVNNVTSLTTGTNNAFFGINAGNLVTTGSNKLILGGFSGNVTNADPTKALDLRTSATSAVVVSDVSGNVRAVCDNLGRWGLGTTTPFGALDVAGLVRLTQATEKVQLSTTPLTGTFLVNVNIGSVVFFTVAATGNFGFNFTGDASAAYTGTLNGLLQVGDSITVAVVTTQGSTPYFNNLAPTVDGTATGVTTRWQGPVSPSFGSANGYDVYLFNIIKTAATPTYSILASRTQFGGS